MQKTPTFLFYLYKPLPHINPPELLPSHTPPYSSSTQPVSPSLNKLRPAKPKLRPTQAPSQARGPSGPPLSVALKGAVNPK